MTSTPGASPAKAPSRQRRGRLFRKYALVFGLVVTAALVAGGAVQGYSSYKQTKAGLMRLQEQQAATAAVRIEDFIGEVQRQLSGYAQLEVLPNPDGLDGLRDDYLRLLRVTPAISDLSYFDPDGREQLRLSRGSRTIEHSTIDFSNDPQFKQTRSGRTYYSPVTFRDGSEPYMTIAVAESGPDRGVISAQVNLKFIWEEVVSPVRFGGAGYAFVVDDRGQLIAHPQLSLVLRKTDFSSLPQVRKAITTKPLQPAASVGEDLQGMDVLSAHKAIATTGWLVFVEQPASKAFAPLNAYLLRTAGLLALGVGLALAAGMLVARSMVSPIRVLQASAAEIGAGSLEQHIELHTNDELEELAAEFNDMAARLRASYAGLEEKVDERTQALQEALGQLAERSHQLEVADRHKSEFLANMSHELRTPLNAIIGFSEVLLGQGRGELNETQRDYVMDVLVSGKHLLALINDILDLSKVESGHVELELSTFSIGDVLESSVTMVRERAAAHGISLAVSLEEGVDLIVGDERKIRQVLFNLLTNAVKFTPDGGEVHLRGRLGEESVELSVSDTGVGIAIEDQARIFEEFQQAGEDSSARLEGTGLGLAIARRLVELHGGTLQVHSTPGQGSTFKFELPYSPMEAKVGVPAPHPSR